jgi:hypothetical protein
MKHNNVTKQWMIALTLGTMGIVNLAAPVVAAQAGTSSGTTSTTQTSRPDPLQVVLDNIAAKLGRALTDSETSEIKTALATAKEEAEEANATMVEDIADTFDLTIDQVKAALQKRAPLVQTLSDLVGHKLTKAEVDALRAATKARRDALKTVHDELVETIASITGLTPEEADETLRPPAPPKPEDKPADKPADKPECKPGGGQGGQQGGQGGQAGGKKTGQQGGQCGQKGGMQLA